MSHLDAEGGGGWLDRWEARGVGCSETNKHANTVFEEKVLKHTLNTVFRHIGKHKV